MYGSAYLNRPPVQLGQRSLSSRDVHKGHESGISSFLYNGRVAAVLISSLSVLVGYGGPLVAGVLLVRC